MSVVCVANVNAIFCIVAIPLQLSHLATSQIGWAKNPFDTSRTTRQTCANCRNCAAEYFKLKHYRVCRSRHQRVRQQHLSRALVLLSSVLRSRSRDANSHRSKSQNPAREGAEKGCQRISHQQRRGPLHPRRVVPALPKPGGILHFETTAGMSLACEVHRADWNEGKDCFIVYCKYSSRSIPLTEYNALLDDADWTMRPLL
jgi:hypothetical protein